MEKMNVLYLAYNDIRNRVLKLPMRTVHGEWLNDLYVVIELDFVFILKGEIMVEKWKNIPKHPTYLVSNLGNLKRDSFTRVNTKGETVTYKAKPLKPSPIGRYYRVEYWVNGKRVGFTFIHRLVYTLFVGDIKEGLVVDHIDGITSNNNVGNLRVVTHTQNTWNRPAKGYSLHKESGKYHARVTAHGKLYSLGYYKTEYQAKQAYKEGCIKYHKGFCDRELSTSY